MSQTPSIPDRLLAAALPHVAFDGWSPATWKAALSETGIDPVVARAMLPREAVDLALAFHAAGDAAMRARLAETDLSGLKFRDRVALAVRFRLDAANSDRDAVRRGLTLLSQPQYTAAGIRALWQTADTIWDALGDTSRDGNWYTKRASLSAVYSATLLFWLGDESDGFAETWAFLDRRIGEVMKVEKLKSDLRGSSVFGPLMAAPDWLTARIRAPERDRRQGMPGSLGGQGKD